MKRQKVDSRQATVLGPVLQYVRLALKEHRSSADRRAAPKATYPLLHPIMTDCCHDVRSVVSRKSVKTEPRDRDERSNASQLSVLRSPAATGWLPKMSSSLQVA